MFQGTVLDLFSLFMFVCTLGLEHTQSPGAGVTCVYKSPDMVTKLCINKNIHKSACVYCMPQYVHEGQKTLL